MRYHAPVFKRNKCWVFLRVGHSPTRYLPFASDVDAQQASDCIRAVGDPRKGVDRVNLSPRDRQSSTCAKSIISGSNRRAYQWPRGDAWSVRSPSERMIAIDGFPGDSWGRSDLHQTDRNLHRMDDIAIFIAIFTDRTAGGGPSSRSWHTGSGESRSSTHLKLHQTAGKIRERTPRSQSDRTAIAARWSRDRGSFIMDSMPRSRRTIPTEHGKRKGHDRGPIAS